MDANAQSHKLTIFDARQSSVAVTNKVQERQAQPLLFCCLPPLLMSPPSVPSLCRQRMEDMKVRPSTPT